MSKLENFIILQNELLKLENKFIIENNGLLIYDDLKQEGYILSNLLFESQCTTLGRIEVTFRLKNRERHRVQCRDAVILHDNKNHLSIIAKGVISSIFDDTITVLCDVQKYSRIDENLSYGLQKNTFDISYKRIINALNLLSFRINFRLRDILFNSVEPQQILLPPKLLSSDGKLKYFNGNLNDDQKKAVEFALTRKEIAIIHGPPGTGKTTTVVEIIQQLEAAGCKVLVCAPSNLAVDQLLEKLSRKMKVVRLGHPARMLNTTREFSLDALLASSSAGQEEKENRKEIQALESELNSESKPSKKHMKLINRRIMTLRSKSRDLIEKAQREVLSNVKVVLGTLISSSADGPLSALPHCSTWFDVVIIDECSQALEAACWIVLEMGKKVILAGDHKQLPPTVRCIEAFNRGLSYTLMERAIAELGEGSYYILTRQYRMNSAIMNWVSNQMYTGQLIADAKVEKHLLKDLPGVATSEETGIPLLLVDTAGCDMEEDTDAQSFYNEGEASVIAMVVRKLIEAGVPDNAISVITPYGLQVKCIMTKLPRKMNVEVRTIDGFQGRENECILLSLVRSNQNHEMGFLLDYRRLNVAVSRARRFLCVVADSYTVNRDPVYKSLLKHIEDHGEIQSAYSYKEGKEYEDIPQFIPTMFKESKHTKENLKKEKSIGVNKLQCSKLSINNPVQYGHKSDAVNVPEVQSIKDSDLLSKQKYLVLDTETEFHGDGENEVVSLQKGQSTDIEKKIRVPQKESKEEACASVSNIKQVKKKTGCGSSQKCETKVDNQPEDFDTTVKRFVKSDKVCKHSGCKESITLFGQKCAHCGKLYCLSHSLPEIHGCGDSARKSARREFLHPQKAMTAEERKKASTKLKKAISSKAQARKPQTE